MNYILPLQQSQQMLSNNPTTSSGTATNYRAYQMLNNRPNIQSLIFENNSSNSNSSPATVTSLDNINGDMLLISTRPREHIPDPWNPHSLHHQQHQQQQQHQQHQQQQHHQHHQHHTHPLDFHSQGAHYDRQPHITRPNANAPLTERGIAGFVSKLYQCLQSPESKEKYAKWCQHDGKDMFIIDCIPEFTEVVLPRLFKHCKFPSFVRQLNIYGFQRDTDARKSKDTKDKESCRWYHPYFRPGRRDLFHLIRRKATRYSRKKRPNKVSSNDEDPDTILDLGSGDESEIEENNSIGGAPILLRDEDNRRSSSSSSVHQPLQLLDYNSSSSQLQLGYNESGNITAHDNSPNLTHHQVPTMIETGTINEYKALTSASKSNNIIAVNHNNHNMIKTETVTPLLPDDIDDRIMDPNIAQSMTFEEIRLKLINEIQRHNKTKEQLAAAQLHNSQLEKALGLTSHSVKQSTGGYMGSSCTTLIPSFNDGYNISLSQQNASLNNNAPRLMTNTNHHPSNHTHDNNSPRPGVPATNYYYHENKAEIKDNSRPMPSLVSHHLIPTANNVSWNSAPYHPTANGIVTAGSNTAADSMMKSNSGLHSISPLINSNSHSNHTVPYGTYM